MSRTEYKPEARKKQLIARKSEGELLVYDTERHRAHSLDAQLAALWRACDGKKSVRALAQELELPEPALWIALERLGAARLLREPPPATTATATAPTRRQWLRRATALGLGLASITVPRLSEAATTITAGQCNQRTPPNCGGQPCNSGGSCRMVLLGGMPRCRCA